MARYYLVNYVRNAQGNWQSPPECEDAWDEGCFRQDRFDNDSGVAFVTCMSDMGLPAPAQEVTLDEGLAWLAGLMRLPKTRPTPSNPTEPIVNMTLAEEQAYIRQVATSWTGRDVLAHAMRPRSL